MPPLTVKPKAGCRFDVVSIVLRPGAEPQVEHLKHAFWAF